jgi:hypothetical protein
MEYFPNGEENFRVLVGTSDGSRLGVNVRMILKWILKK